MFAGCFDCQYVKDKGRSIYLVWPIMTRSEPTFTRHSIQRRQLQRSRVHQYKVPSTSLINLIKAIIDTIHIIWDGCHVQAAIRQESTSSKVIGADPHRVNCVVRSAIRVKRIRVSRRIDILRIRDESIDFIHNVWEWAEYAGEVAVDDLVGTDSAANGVVVKLRTGIDRYPAIPSYPSAWGVGALRK